MENFDTKAAHWDGEQYRVDRAKALATAMEQVLPPLAGCALADVGCGTGLLGFEFADSVASIAFLDTSPGMLGVVQEKISQRACANAAAILVGPDLVPLAVTGSPNLTGAFDVVVSLMMLHHVPHIPAMVDAMVSLLKPGGCLCLADLDEEDGSFHAPEVVPHNGINRPWLAGLLEQAGCSILIDQVVFTNTKTINGRGREYPLFLMAGQKGST